MIRASAIICGLGPGDGGTGQVVKWMRGQSANLVCKRPNDRGFPVASGIVGVTKVIAHGMQRAACEMHLAATTSNLVRKPTAHLVLMHPQALGFAWTLRAIERFAHRCSIYLLDNSFFCVRSYNYMPPGGSPCYRCLGTGGGPAVVSGCTPWPSGTQREAVDFVARLRELGSQGKVRFLLQCASQDALVAKHFGNVSRATVGIWAADWEAEFNAFLSRNRHSPPPEDAASGQVVFHGNDQPAKGMRWAMELAECSPDLEFVFPFSRPLDVSAPPNCRFIPMSWRTGLRDAVARARLTLVPSLWTAPVEGALIKSLMVGRRVAVLGHIEGFGASLRGAAIDLLPLDVRAAATEISGLSGTLKPDEEEIREKWILQFAASNRDFLAAIFRRLSR